MCRLDPHRWDGVPITYDTAWSNRDDHFTHIKTCVMIHEALEREFSCEIDDRKILLEGVKECINLLLDHHGAI